MLLQSKINVNVVLNVLGVCVDATDPCDGQNTSLSPEVSLDGTMLALKFDLPYLEIYLCLL